MPKKSVMFVVKLVVTGGLFVLLFWPEKFGLAADVFGGIKPGDLLREVREANGRDIAFWLSFALVVKLTGMFCNMLRWRLLLKGQGLDIPFLYLVQSFFVGRMVGIFLPGTIGLDGYRLYDSSVYTGEVIKCTTVIVVEKLTGLIALTVLVFLTFPLGFRLFNMNVPTLLIMLGIAGSVVAVLLLLLLNPRIIQILVAILPTPGLVRSKLDKMGMAATAYSGGRLNLLLAVFLGLLGHTSTCFMYFGTMSAIRAENTGLLDILFAAPLMIGATVIGPSVGGEGIREIVFVTMLAGTTSAVAAATLAHLGWWVGELVPFLIGWPIFLLRKRPPREEIEARLAEARAAAAGPAADYLHLDPVVISMYARRVYGCLVAGVLGGLLAGGAVGIAESFWHHRMLAGLVEMQMFTWGPVVYGLCFAGIGLGVAGGLLLIYLLFDRFASWRVSYALSFAGTAGLIGMAIALFQYNRDVMDSDGIPMDKKVMVAAFVGGAVIIASVVVYAIAALTGKLLRERPAGLVVAGILAWGICIVTGMQIGQRLTPVQAPPTFQAVANPGPDIIFIGIDTLRADYLRLYGAEGKAQTPALEAFAQDAVLFEKAFAQSSWTKPAFGTLFTGLYPESHTATTKTALLPEEVDTFAELLQAAGYYTQGFSNNPNTDTLFNFDQGFVEYTDLKPDHYFGAELSSSKLFMYNILRMVKGQFAQRVGMKLVKIPYVGMPLFRGLVQFEVTEHYQPAEVVTGVALDWLDSGAAPEGSPLCLFLHYMDPHDPFMDPDYIEGGYARSRMADPDPDTFTEPMKNAYISDIEYMDTHLGVLFEGLKARGRYDDALIIFTSDHGEEFQEHGGWWHGQTLYDEQTHVPLIIKLPKGNRHGGERNPHLARHVDLAPTMLHFAGVEKGARMPGQSLYDQASEAFTNADIGYAYAEVHFEGQDVQAVRSQACKLINTNADNPRGLPPVELFDMIADPGEQNNLAGQGTQVTCEQDLSRSMVEYQKVVEENAAEPSGQVPISAELSDQLKALGYID